MYRKKGFYLIATTLMICTLVAIAFAAPRPRMTDDEMAARTSERPGGGHLDQNYNQLRYVKTTDFGATWTLAQAGDLSTFAPYDEAAFGDFSAVTMANGELCYLIYLSSAATPGVYSLSGPNFTPVLVVAEGANDFGAYGYFPGGHTEISRAADGGLVGIIWGADAIGANTVWACKSTNNGSSWTSWVIATEPTIPANEADFGWFKMPDRVDEQWAWTLFQDPGAAGQWDMKVLRFDHTTTNTGTITTVDWSNHQFSYMFSGTKPIAYDPANNWLYIVFRNHDLSGVLVWASSNAGASWAQEGDVAAPAQRYPAVALNAAAQKPYMVYGETVGALQPGDEQCVFWSQDEIGYGGASLISPAVEYECITLFDENTAGFNSVYFPQIWWWDANNGVGKADGYTNFLSGEIIYTHRTTDGGATWSGFAEQMHYVDDQFNAGTMQPSELVGGEAGVAYVIFSAAPGITDEQAPDVSNLEWLGTGVPGTGPYPFKAFYSDNVGIDTTNPSGAGPWINWGETSDPGAVEVANWDSVHLTAPERQEGWYYYTVPGGWAQGDSLWIYADGYDLSGSYNSTPQQIIVAGVTYLDVFRPSNGRVTEYALLGNYPNPFNPSTTIEFNLPMDSRVTLAIYNTLGQTVRTLVGGDMMGAGTHGIVFDASDLPTGLYLYRLTAGEFTDTQKMLLVK